MALHHKPAATRTRSKLKKHDRLRLIEARLQEKSEVTLVIAASPGANKKVIDQITRVGGRIQYRDDDVSYLRVKVPVISVESIAQSPEIEALNIDGSFIYVSQAHVPANEGQSPQNRIPPPDAKTPAENPYLPSREIGAPQFISSNPTFDGRGAVVAIVDTNIDVLTPELQTAKTLDGKPTRKILDITNGAMYALDPSDDKGRLSSYIQVDMREEVNASNTMLVHRDIRYTAPADGQYRFGMLDERMNGNSKGDLNLDGNPAGSSGLFAVLWEQKTNTVWVDTNQNRNFADEKAMSDYPINGDIGLFGKENAREKFRRTIGFTVQTDATHQLVFITPGLSLHGTAVTGGAFGKNFFGGSVNGVAPEAQIVSVPFLGVTHSFIESVIVAVKHPQVDIVSVQVYFYTAMNDGDSTLSNVCNRLVERYKKPIFSAAGNSVDAVNVVHEGAAASRVIAVGSYINQDTSRVNYGVATKRRDNIDIASSRGPTEVGAFKPDILAPTMSLTTMPGHTPVETYNNTYELPPGYGVGSGTSTATPMAAAAAALLVSAAKQSGVPYDANRVRWAISTGARYLPDYGAYEQGTGLFQIGPAWEALKVAKIPVEIETRASVKTVLSQFLKEPNQGSGIYEREGWAIGQQGTRIITLTRTTGKTSPIIYN
ncbi:MAG TPA: S8 family serine peptidase, partial [Candidatus Binatia bacterium]